MKLDKCEIHEMLSCDNDNTQDLSIWLRNRYLPYLISKFNCAKVRKCFGLYQGEKIPENERNLTDVRNRVSLLIEHDLAALSNEILEEYDIHDMFWCYVVANRFPDLEIRKNNGERCMRIEVKCLQSMAEEKSANFDTLIKDINPKTDFVVVFLWEWDYKKNSDINWDRTPKILDAFVFNAYSLARLRDTYWLNKPPTDLGTGYQGFDLRYGLNCKESVYSEEEGNYGKLMRIWQRDFKYRPVSSPVLIDTENEYYRFKDKVIFEGFRSLSELYLPVFSDSMNSELEFDNRIIGYLNGMYAFMLKSRIPSGYDYSVLNEENGVQYVVTFTDKYDYTGLKYYEGKLKKRFQGKKPKNLGNENF